MKIIGVWSISNVASLNIYEIEHGINSRVLVGINDERTWRTIEHDLDSDRSYIKYAGSRYYLDECMRT